MAGAGTGKIHLQSRLRNGQALLVLLIVLLASGLTGCAAFTRTPSNQKLGPAVSLGHLLPKTIRVQYTWAGRGPFAVIEAYELHPNAGNRTYEATGTLTHTPYDASKAKTITPIALRLPSETILALLQSIDQPVWHPTRRPEEVIEHPDDYPNRLIDVENEKGDQVFKLVSSSNTPGGAPWNLTTNRAEQYSTQNAAVSQAVGNLMLALHGQATPAASVGAKVNIP